MGGCRMGLSVRDSVVDLVRLRARHVESVRGRRQHVRRHLRAVNPTLTMVALALRTADFIDHQVS